MNRRIRSLIGAVEQADRALLGAVAVLLAFGSIVILGVGNATSYSAGSPLGPFNLIVRHLVMIIAGLIAMFTLMHIDYRLYRHKWINGGALVVAYGLVGTTLLIGRTTASGGSAINRWVSIAGFTFQPAELAKLVLMVFLAARLTQARKGQTVSGRKVLLTLATGVLPLLVLLGLQPNYSNMLVTVGVTVVIVFASGVGDRWLLPVVVLVPVGAVAGFILNTKIHSRVLRFWDGLQRGDFGYQVNQSLYGMGAGGWMGLGSGQSHNKYNFLPEAHTDFVFSVLGEEWGLFGTLMVIAMLVLFAWRGYAIAGRARESYGRALAAGLTTGIVIYGTANIAMVTGLMPVMGVPLPFVSYGGTAMITGLATVGVLVNIERGGLAAAELQQRQNRGARV